MNPPPRSVRPRRLLFPALAAALLLSLGTGASLATGLPPDSAPAATDNAADSVAPAAYIGWVDRTHSWVERDLFETVVWFDRFFGNERMDVTERPESFLRWMNDLRWDEEEHLSFRSTISAARRAQHPRPVHGDRVLGRPGRSRRIEPGRPRALARPPHPAPMVQLPRDRGEEQRVDVGDGPLPPPQAFPEKRDHHRRGRLGVDPTGVDRTELPGPRPVPPERLAEMALPRGGARHPLAEEGRREPEAGVGRDTAGGDPVHRRGTDSAGRWRERALTPK
jgi:hypothetical protein